MLTREQGLFTFSGHRIIPDRLTRRAHAQYADLAAKMLEIYRTGRGRMRQELHREVRRLFESEGECPARRIDAFCRLLDDASTYSKDPTGEAAKLRTQVFRRAASSHPLVLERDLLFESTASDTKLRVAQEIGRPWPTIERDLFADVMEFHRLQEFHGYPDPQALLSRYNVAQIQVALYRATEMRIEAGNDFKDLLRSARLKGLMHTIRQLGSNRYELRFDGPASVLRRTRRYGVAMAGYLPAVLGCRDWKLQARIETGKPGRTAILEVSSEDGLRSSRTVPDDYDSMLESDFARNWGPEPRDGWTLLREGEILQQGQRLFFPDFAFRHQDGRTVLLEIIGFWTPQYLQQKIETLQTFSSRPILLAVDDALGSKLPPLPHPVLRFKKSLKVEAVLEALQRSGMSVER